MSDHPIVALEMTSHCLKQLLLGVKNCFVVVMKQQKITCERACTSCLRGIKFPQYARWCLSNAPITGRLYTVAAAVGRPILMAAVATGRVTGQWQGGRRASEKGTPCRRFIAWICTCVNISFIAWICTIRCTNMIQFTDIFKIFRFWSKNIDSNLSYDINIDDRFPLLPERYTCEGYNVCVCAWKCS